MRTPNPDVAHTGACASTERTAGSSDKWYRQPVLWLGMLIFVASLAGCIWMIVLGARHADESVSDTDTTILGMPIHGAAQAPRSDAR